VPTSFSTYFLNFISFLFRVFVFILAPVSISSTGH